MDSSRIALALNEAADSLKAAYTEHHDAAASSSLPLPKRISLRQFLDCKYDLKLFGAKDGGFDNKRTITLAKVLFGKKSRSSATDKSNIWEKALTDTPIKYSYALAFNYYALLQKQIKLTTLHSTDYKKCATVIELERLYASIEAAWVAFKNFVSVRKITENCLVFAEKVSNHFCSLLDSVQATYGEEKAVILARCFLDELTVPLGKFVSRGEFVETIVRESLESAKDGFITIDLPCEGHTFEGSLPDKKLSCAIENTVCGTCNLKVCEDIVSRLFVLSEHQTPDHALSNRIAENIKNAEGHCDADSYKRVKLSLRNLIVDVVKAAVPVLTVAVAHSEFDDGKAGVSIRDCMAKASLATVTADITKTLAHCASNMGSMLSWNEAPAEEEEEEEAAAAAAAVEDGQLAEEEFVSVKVPSSMGEDASVAAVIDDETYLSMTSIVSRKRKRGGDSQPPPPRPKTTNSKRVKGNLCHVEQNRRCPISVRINKKYFDEDTAPTLKNERNDFDSYHKGGVVLKNEASVKNAVFPISVTTIKENLNDASAMLAMAPHETACRQAVVEAHRPWLTMDRKGMMASYDYNSLCGPGAVSQLDRVKFESIFIERETENGEQYTEEIGQPRFTKGIRYMSDLELFVLNAADRCVVAHADDKIIREQLTSLTDNGKWRANVVMDRAAGIDKLSSPSSLNPFKAGMDAFTRIMNKGTAFHANNARYVDEFINRAKSMKNSHSINNEQLKALEKAFSIFNRDGNLTVKEAARVKHCHLDHLLAWGIDPTFVISKYLFTHVFNNNTSMSHRYSTLPVKMYDEISMAIRHLDLKRPEEWNSLYVMNRNDMSDRILAFGLQRNGYLNKKAYVPLFTPCTENPGGDPDTYPHGYDSATMTLNSAPLNPKMECMKMRMQQQQRRIKQYQMAVVTAVDDDDDDDDDDIEFLEEIGPEQKETVLGSVIDLAEAKEARDSKFEMAKSKLVMAHNMGGDTLAKIKEAQKMETLKAVEGMCESDTEIEGTRAAMSTTYKSMDRAIKNVSLDTVFEKEMKKGVVQGLSMSSFVPDVSGGGSVRGPSLVPLPEKVKEQMEIKSAAHDDAKAKKNAARRARTAALKAAAIEAVGGEEEYMKQKKAAEAERKKKRESSKKSKGEERSSKKTEEERGERKKKKNKNKTEEEEERKKKSKEAKEERKKTKKEERKKSKKTKKDTKEDEKEVEREAAAAAQPTIEAQQQQQQTVYSPTEAAAAASSPPPPPPWQPAEQQQTIFIDPEEAVYDLRTMLTSGDSGEPLTSEEVADAVGSIVFEMTSQEFDCTDNFIENMGATTTATEAASAAAAVETFLATPPCSPLTGGFSEGGYDDREEEDDDDDDDDGGEASLVPPPLSRPYASCNGTESAFSATSSSSSSSESSSDDDEDEEEDDDEKQITKKRKKEDSTSESSDEEAETEVKRRKKMKTRKQRELQINKIRRDPVSGYESEE